MPHPTGTNGTGAALPSWVYAGAECALLRTWADGYSAKLNWAAERHPCPVSARVERVAAGFAVVRLGFPFNRKGIFRAREDGSLYEVGVKYAESVRDELLPAGHPALVAREDDRLAPLRRMLDAIRQRYEPTPGIPSLVP